MPDPQNAGDRVKAFKLRKKVKATPALVPAVDKLWLAEYEEKLKPPPPPKEPPTPSKNYGRSRSGRKMSFQLEEAAESEGTGNAAALAAAAALQAKEEGRRIDKLSVNALEMMKEAVATYRAFAKDLRDNERAAQRRLARYEDTHVAMLESVRAHFLAKTEAETELREVLRQQQEGGDGANGLLFGLLAKHFGLDVPTKPNGAAK